MDKNGLPDIGDIVEVKDDRFTGGKDRFRVKSFLEAVMIKPKEFRKAQDIHNSMKEILSSILLEAAHKDKQGYRYRFSPKESATHVSMSGVCGWRVPFSDFKSGKCKVVGRIPRTELRIHEDVERAKSLHGEWVM
jgi:hypothetical protein